MRRFIPFAVGAVLVVAAIIIGGEVSSADDAGRAVVTSLGRAGRAAAGRA